MRLRINYEVQFLINLNYKAQFSVNPILKDDNDKNQLKKMSQHELTL
jgi:hypothetical protein